MRTTAASPSSAVFQAVKALALASVQSNAESGLPDELAVTFAVTGALEILSWWLRQDEPPSAKVVAGYLNRLAIAPVLGSTDLRGSLPREG